MLLLSLEIILLTVLPTTITDLTLKSLKLYDFKMPFSKLSQALRNLNFMAFTVSVCS